MNCVLDEDAADRVKQPWAPMSQAFVTQTTLRDPAKYADIQRPIRNYLRYKFEVTGRLRVGEVRLAPRCTNVRTSQPGGLEQKTTSAKHCRS